MALRKSLKLKFGKYEKFKAKTNKILVLDNGSSISNNYGLALKKSSDDIFVFPISYSKKIFPDYYKRFTDVLKSFKPDVIFLIDFTSFDKEGRLVSLLNILDIKVIIYLSVYPLLMLSKYDLQNYNNFIFFVPDMSWIYLLKKEFNLEAYYLPFALDENIAKLELDSSLKPYKLIYTGSTNLDKIDGLKFINPKNKEIDINELVDYLLQRYLNQDKKDLLDIMIILTEYEKKNKIILSFENSKERYFFIIKLIYLSDIFLKKGLLTPLINQDYFKLFGDKRWMNIIKNRNRVYKLGDTFLDLLSLYASSKIGLNITSFMMPYSFNHKFFEMPLFDCLPLCDYRDEYIRQFNKIDNKFNELPVYSDSDELMLKAEYYLQNENERVALNSHLKNIILSEHRYHNRAEILSKFINNKFR